MINPKCILMNSSILLDTMYLGWFIVLIKGTQVRTFKLRYTSVQITFMLANSTDPDEMPHLAAFHLALHCIPKNLFGGFPSKKD